MGQSSILKEAVVYTTAPFLYFFSILKTHLFSIDYQPKG